jgi:putative effector of murein hydrolase LrgA (UPF0299 family)
MPDTGTTRLGERSIHMPTEVTALVLLFSLVASRQIKLRRIDGRQNIDVVLNQHSPVAA